MKPAIVLFGVLVALGTLVVPAAAQSDAIVQGQVVAAASLRGNTSSPPQSTDSSRDRSSS